MIQFTCTKKIELRVKQYESLKKRLKNYSKCLYSKTDEEICVK